MINTTFDNDPNFVEKFIEFWTEYRSLFAGRPETMLKKMVYFHNCLYPDFAIGECFNCGSRWKRAEDRLDLAFALLNQAPAVEETPPVVVKKKNEKNPFYGENLDD